MESCKNTSIPALFYLILINSSIYLLDTLLISKNFPFSPQHVKVKKAASLPLRFRSDGTFKILQVADMHYGNGMLTRCRDVLENEFQYCSDLNTTRFLEKMIQLEKPDLIAFTGDSIFGSSAADAAESLFQAFGPVLKSGIPWAAVLGNHDQESTMTREELMYFISLMDFSVSQTFPSSEENTSNPKKQNTAPKIDGFGNYNLLVWGAPGSSFANNSVLNLYFLDSGDRAIVDGIRTYGWIKESQLSWLRRVSKKLQVTLTGRNENSNKSFLTASDSTTSLSLAFFHIPIPEIKQGPIKNMTGTSREHVACSIVNSGVLNTLVSMGDVKAVFIGHDHTNDFCGNLEGIWFCYGGGFGYHGYGVAGWPRRARIILAELGRGEREWNGVERIRTWKRLDDETLSKIDEQILWERES
ncbi:probable inactive purple acid phosphatase 28 [Primulina huaijiensis]|uniref:probable inactive purple acid phosphatase 28 n=1 Tax=Primulina huaijiensis TaxID=1492673 RepID=UPI003CC781EA